MINALGPVVPTPLHAPDEDALLVTLVHLVNRTPGGSMGITLNIPGATVTGTLIRNQDWLDAVAGVVSGATGVGREALADMFTRWHEILDEGLPDDQKVDDRLPGMIHLRDAKYLVGEGLVPTDIGTHWRGRISEVSGWSIGTMTIPG